ncbi:MAG: hypothetical protein ACI4E4_10375 [Acetatifactor sp.]
MKKYVLFAGVNGAGKSTLFLTQESLKQIERVNIDEIVRSFGDWESGSLGVEVWVSKSGCQVLERNNKQNLKDL